MAGGGAGQVRKLALHPQGAEAGFEQHPRLTVEARDAVDVAGVGGHDAMLAAAAGQIVLLATFERLLSTPALLTERTAKYQVPIERLVTVYVSVVTELMLATCDKLVGLVP